ncbi:MAG: sensor histidine kinase [Gaiellales bacterium]
MARRLVLVGALAAATALALTLTSDHLRYRWADALLLANTITAFAVAGALWVVRRAVGRLWACLAACALGWSLVSLQSADSSLLFSLGVLADWPLAIATVYALMAFPIGWPTSPVGVWAVRLVTVVIGALTVTQVLLSPTVSGNQPLSSCAPACPPNALQVGSISASALSGLGKLESLGAACAAAAVCFELVRWYRNSGPPRRRALSWIVAVGVPYAVVLGVHELTKWVAAPPHTAMEALRWSRAGLSALLPWAFAASLVHAEISAGSALDGLVSGLAHHESPLKWQHDMAQALGDPSVRVGYWSAGEKAYVGVDGRILERPEAGRGWLEIDRPGRPVAAISYDPVLELDPELLDAVGTATLISLDSGRMEDEVRAARVRMLGAAEAERRRLERDLQEGAEQRLLAVRVKLGLVGQVDRGDVRRLMGEIAEDLDATLDDLRRLAHRIYPPLLREEGLVPALRAAARRLPIPVDVRGDDIGRHPIEVEAAVYFCCLEAVDAAVPGAGPDTRVSVTVAAERNSIRFRVAESGSRDRPPTAREAAGLNLVSERVQAMGGNVAIRTAADHARVVEGDLPIAVGR